MRFGLVSWGWTRSESKISVRVRASPALLDFGSRRGSPRVSGDRGGVEIRPAGGVSNVRGAAVLATTLAAVRVTAIQPNTPEDRVSTYLHFDVRLSGLSPPPWRQLLLPARASFLDLHHAIQDACGWHDPHLFMFRGTGRAAEAVATSPNDDEANAREAGRIRLSEFFKKEGDHLVYEYDFGDSWEHEVVLKAVVASGEAFKRRLVGGELAFPKEDCGGVPGYLDCVRVLAGGADRDGLREWIADWRPDRFDLEACRRRFDN